MRVVDLIKQIGHADKRPLSGTFQFGEHTLGDRTRATLIVPSASRITWTQALPRRGVLHADAAVPDGPASAAVTFRVGISDDRIYETLAERVVTRADTLRDGWTPIAVDLSLYAGPKLSIFYRPDSRRWRIVLATSPSAGAPEVAYWGAPGIDTDTKAARLFRRASAATTGPSPR